MSGPMLWNRLSGKKVGLDLLDPQEKKSVVSRLVGNCTLLLTYTACGTKYSIEKGVVKKSTQMLWWHRIIVKS